MKGHLLLISLSATAAFMMTASSPPFLVQTTPPRVMLPHSCSSTAAPRIFLTREDGKNEKLRQLLEAGGIATEELPCIAFERLPGYDDLCDTIATKQPDWIVVTSPEAAGVLIEAWYATGSPQLPRLASVGAGTTQVLSAAGLTAAFVPTKATGKTLAAELPRPSDNSKSELVLYPASALAAKVVEDGLAERGFRTQRIDTYTTLPATWNADDFARARSAKIVTFASPSAVRAWSERVGTSATAVCIGETSAKECRRVGFASESVHSPESPGIESWAQSVMAVVDELTNVSA